MSATYVANVLPEDAAPPWTLAVNDQVAATPPPSVYVANGVLHMKSTGDRLQYFRVEDVGALASHYTIEAVGGFAGALVPDPPGVTSSCNLAVVAGVLQDRDLEVAEGPGGIVLLRPLEFVPGPLPQVCNYGIQIGQVDPTVDHDFRIEATRDQNVDFYVDGSLLATVPWSSLGTAPDLSGAPYFAPPDAVVARFGPSAGAAARWESVSYTIVVTPPPPGLGPPAFKATAPFGNLPPITDVASLGAVLGAPHVLVTATGLAPRGRVSTPARLIIRPPVFSHTVLIQIGARTARKTASIRLRSVPQELSNLAPKVDIRAWDTDFNRESVTDLEGRKPSPLKLQDGTETTDTVGGRPVGVDRLTLTSLSPEHTTADVRQLGWLRFDGKSRIVSRQDLNWTDDTKFGTGNPADTPSVEGHLTSGGFWADYTLGPVWPAEEPSHMLMGTTDLPTMTLHLRPPYPEQSVPVTSSWPVTATPEPYTAQTDGRLPYSMPSNLYRARIGVPQDVSTLEAEAGGGFSYTMEAPSSGSGCYTSDAGGQSQVVQVQLHRLQLHVPYGGTNQSGLTYTVGAGRLFLGRPGDVGLPYLTSGGSLAPGTKTLSSTCAGVEEQGTVTSP